MDITREMLTWAYRLFLDREPESKQVIDSKLKSLKTPRDLRNEFLSSFEYLQHNPRTHPLSLSGNEPALEIDTHTQPDKLFAHIQKVWQELGASEPHWSVLTWDKFKSSQKIQEDEFYETGRADVEQLFTTLARNNITKFKPKTCLEFGCGLGRVTYWLAKQCPHVIAYDISKPHLNLALKHFESQGISNIDLKHINKTSDLSDFPKVDLIYSIVVLQHNPPPMIRIIVRELLKALNQGGIAYFQVPTYRKDYSFSLKDYLSNAVKNAEMEMHVLPQHEIFEIAYQEKCMPVEVLEDDLTGLPYGERSNTFVFQKL